MLYEVEEKLAKWKEFTVKVPLGKVDCYGTGRKVNEADMEVTLRQRKEGVSFSVCADVWNAKHTDICWGGQCVEEVCDLVRRDVKDKSLVQKAEFLTDMWRKYHLNDMHAGTPAQEQLLKEAVKNGELKNRGADEYSEKCEYLKRHGMLVDDSYISERFPDGYKYGNGWLFEEIPERDFDFIQEFMVTGEVPEEYKSATKEVEFCVLGDEEVER